MNTKDLMKKYGIIVGVIVGIFALVGGAAFVVYMAISNIDMSGSESDGPPGIVSNGDNNGGGEGSSASSSSSGGWFAPPSRLTVLVLGVDEHNNNDTNLIVTLNTRENTIDVISVPRDTNITLSASAVMELREVHGRGDFVPATGNMIFGNLYPIAGRNQGPIFAKRHLSALFGIRIDNFMVVELAVFRTLVDLMDGVYFDVPFRMYYTYATHGGEVDVNLQPGLQRLDGVQAEMLVRYRRTYATADLGRINMQQQFMGAAFGQILQSDSIRNDLPGYTRAVLDRVRTDLVLTDAMRLHPVFSDLTAAAITFHTIPVTEATGGRLSYDAARGRELFDSIFGQDR